MKDVKKYFQFLPSDIIENILKDLTLTKKRGIAGIVYTRKGKSKNDGLYKKYDQFFGRRYFRYI